MASVRRRVVFKVATVVNRRLCGRASSYLTDSCCLVTDARPKKLRSANTRTLLVSRTRTNFGDRVFSTAGPRVWNYLPTDLRRPDSSYSRLRQSMKMFLVSGTTARSRALQKSSYRPITKCIRSGVKPYSHRHHRRQSTLLSI